jgi:hypothetical protein
VIRSLTAVGFTYHQDILFLDRTDHGERWQRRPQRRFVTVSRGAIAVADAHLEKHSRSTTVGTCAGFVTDIVVTWLTHRR